MEAPCIIIIHHHAVVSFMVGSGTHSLFFECRSRLWRRRTSKKPWVQLNEQRDLCGFHEAPLPLGSSLQSWRGC